MSLEYTIDVQLIELGFQEVLDPRENPAQETLCHPAPVDPPSISPSPTSPSVTPTETLQVPDQQPDEGEQTEAVKQASDVQRVVCTSSPPLKTEPHCIPVSPAQSSPREQAEEGLAPLQPEDPPEADPSSGSGTTETSGPATGMEQDIEENTDDSEEEEVEEEGSDAVLAEDGSSNSGDFRCSVCALQLSSSLKLQDHMNLHTGARPYCCVECGKRFCQIDNYQVHLRTHAESKADRFECRVCLKAFTSLEDLQGHISKTHFEKSYYECDLCKRLFTLLSDCERHVQAHYQMMVKCDRCGADFASKKFLARHLKESCQPIYRCTDCTKTFSTKTALLKHSFSHLGLLPYTCIRCCSHFRLAKLYRRHHCKPERINCVACLREFSCQGDFEQHKKDTGCWGTGNSKGDEIRCLECGQRFNTLEELKRHTGSHQRVLKCAECGKGFRSALLLMSHMGGHAGQSPCLCQICGRGFPHQQNYDSHLKTCGQTPQPASGPKKRLASRSSSTESKKPNTLPGPSKMPPAASLPAVAENGRPSSGSVDCNPCNGVWKLSLDTPPPAGCQLLLCAPSSQTQSMGLAFPSVVSVEIPAVAEDHRSHAALLIPPLKYVSADTHHRECEAPLDLTKKLEPSKPARSDIPPVPTKSEPKEFEISGEMKKTSVELHPEETYTEVKCKRFKPDPMDLSPFDDSTEMSRLVIDIKEEPPSPGRDLD